MAKYTYLPTYLEIKIKDPFFKVKNAPASTKCGKWSACFAVGVRHVQVFKKGVSTFTEKRRSEKTGGGGLIQGGPYTVLPRNKVPDKPYLIDP